ncbi:vWA domain-containing protein [Roseibium sp.]|uniref:vWA domain-containing protein n=2 Tax=Roseibium sp. TaxID=1936156 RepID=UPI0032636B83
MTSTKIATPFRRLSLCLPGTGIAALIFLAIACQTSAQAATALLEPGTSQIYQRIITKPDGVLVEAPASGSRVIEADVAAFSIFYVFDRTNGYVAVGANINGDAKGWIAETHVVKWRSPVVVAFNNREEANRPQQLFFDSKASLESVVHDEETVTLVSGLTAAAQAGNPPSAGVVALEPEHMIDIEQNFYLFPILDFSHSRLAFRQRGYLLEVASISESEPEQQNRQFRAGIIFVIDTTKSMQPYIDQTREAIRSIQQTLSTSEFGSDVRFGLVGFRQAPGNRTGLEYHVKTFLELAEDSTAEKFVEVIGTMSAATVSTEGFTEDAIGGLYEAIEETDWDGITSKYVVLVTDAGPRPSVMGDNHAGAMNIEQLTALAERKRIRLLAMHLKTDAGQPDHEYARRAYTAATLRHGHPSYIPIEGGKPEAFRDQAGNISRQLVENVTAAREGRVPEAINDSLGAQFMARAGRAMQLEYVGAAQGTEAPRFLRSWTSDMALINPRTRALDVRVLMTRNQLSTLAQMLQPLVEQAMAPGMDADALTFFQRLQEIAAQSNTDGAQIADINPTGLVLEEFLSRLPYRSDILYLQEEDWVRMSRPDQRSLIHGLSSKLRYYQTVHDAPDRWVQLDPTASPGESVILMPLSQMP